MGALGAGLKGLLVAFLPERSRSKGGANVAAALRCALALAGCAIALAWQTPCAIAQAVGGGDDAVVIVGVREGPRLWRVTRNDQTQVWILGTLEPLPKRMRWATAGVERVLHDVDQVVVNAPLVIGPGALLSLFFLHHDDLYIPHGRRLRDTLDGALYARFASARAQLHAGSGDYERWRPLLAGGLLEERALSQGDLASLDIPGQVRRLANKNDVPVRTLKFGKTNDLLSSLSTLSRDAELTCFQASLTTVERNIPQLKARAAAWANGDVGALRRLTQPPEYDACENAIRAQEGFGNIVAHLEDQWYAEISADLDRPKNTLILVPMDSLTRAGGILDRLRAAGARVEGP